MGIGGHLERVRILPKVLVVDDAMFMRTKASKLLTQEGYEVIEAPNGAEAVEVYKAQKPDLVLMDITMPVMDGIEAVKAIKSHDGDAKVIMVTALGQRRMVLEAIRAGAKDFVVKPFQPDKLIEAVRRLCPIA
jgi:two-component system chemotaxis response regulator CheY